MKLKENPMFSDEIRSVMAALGVLAELADRVQTVEGKIQVSVSEEE